MEVSKFTEVVGEIPPGLTEAQLDMTFRNRVLTIIQDFTEAGLSREDIKRNLITLANFADSRDATRTDTGASSRTKRTPREVQKEYKAGEKRATKAGVHFGMG